MTINISAAAVAALTLSAFFYTAITMDNRGPVLADPNMPVSGWQTYCAVPATTDVQTAVIADTTFTFDEVGRPSPHIRSGHLFLSGDGGLVAWDVANNEQFTLEGGEFRTTVATPCPEFQAYGLTVHYRGAEGAVEICNQEQNCSRKNVMPNTLAFSIAAADGAIFVGTSQGDALLFRNGVWCRMGRTATGSYACPAGGKLPIATVASNQFYSSTVFNGVTLVGEYPSGRLFDFDGRRLSPSTLTPPAILDRDVIGFEPQSMAEYCGNLFVGYWPFGEVFRFDGTEWHEPIRLFSSSPPEAAPFREATADAGVIFNFFGQRVPSLVPYGGDLYAVTGNKGDWGQSITPEIDHNYQAEYGAIYRISGNDC